MDIDVTRSYPTRLSASLTGAKNSRGDSNVTVYFIVLTFFHHHHFGVGRFK